MLDWIEHSATGRISFLVWVGMEGGVIHEVLKTQQIQHIFDNISDVFTVQFIHAMHIL